MLVITEVVFVHDDTFHVDDAGVEGFLDSFDAEAQVLDGVVYPLLHVLKLEALGLLSLVY